MAEDYCELCDLPLSTCVHGMPPAPPEPVRASPVRTRREGTAPRRTTGTSRAAGRATTPPPPAPSRVTSPEAFRPHILAVLVEAGGRLETDEVHERLSARLEEHLLERDRQVAPGGEARWWTSVRRERRAMIDQGLVVGAQPGVWELTPRGAELG